MLATGLIVACDFQHSKTLGNKDRIELMQSVV